MTNICLITNGSRPRLLEQTLRTLYENTPADQFNLTMACDGIAIDMIAAMRQYIDDNLSVIASIPGPHIIGRLKNLGAYWSEKQFRRGEWLCFIDDDVAFMSGWLKRMQQAFAERNQLRLLGGVRHPYHQVNEEWAAVVSHGGMNSWPSDDAQEVEITDAVAGYCHFMRWSTWARFGPYDATAKGTGQSEDYAICRKIVDAGGKVGYIYPPVMAHCGLTDSSGKPILGAELIEKQEGILYL